MGSAKKRDIHKSHSKKSIKLLAQKNTEAYEIEQKEQRIKNILKKKKEIEEKSKLKIIQEKDKSEVKGFQTAVSSARNDVSLSKGTLLLRTLGSCKKLQLRKSPSMAQHTLKKESVLTKNTSVRLLNEILRSEVKDSAEIIDISTSAKKEAGEDEMKYL